MCHGQPYELPVLGGEAKAGAPDKGARPPQVCLPCRSPLRPLRPFRGFALSGSTKKPQMSPLRPFLSGGDGRKPKACGVCSAVNTAGFPREQGTSALCSVLTTGS